MNSNFTQPVFFHRFHAALLQLQISHTPCFVFFFVCFLLPFDGQQEVVLFFSVSLTSWELFLTQPMWGCVFNKASKNHCLKLHDSAGSFEDNKTSALSLFSVISLGSVGAFYVFFLFCCHLVSKFEMKSS